tara:strand:+ start:442 stop:726 length:285 start_codon:yes stop_codon:yes gene_type:complete
MHTVTPTTFWASIGFIATAIGGLFSMQTGHASDNGHDSLAGREDLSRAELKLERVATEVNHHTRLLDDMRVEIKEISRRQADSSEEILEAIRGN